MVLQCLALFQSFAAPQAKTTCNFHWEELSLPQVKYMYHYHKVSYCLQCVQLFTRGQHLQTDRPSLTLVKDAVFALNVVEHYGK